MAIDSSKMITRFHGVSNQYPNSYQIEVVDLQLFVSSSLTRIHDLVFFF